MKNEQIINLSNKDVRKIRQIVEAYHRAGLDVDKAEELGYFSRMSFLLCAMHSLYTVAYRIYGEVDNLIERTGTNRLGVKKEIDRFCKSYDQFFAFFRDFQTIKGIREMNEETEYLYHQFMRWCRLPEKWEGGQQQINDVDTDPIIVINDDGMNLNFHRTVVDAKQMEEPKEEWCVSQYDKKARKQQTLDIDGLDKSSAQMVAKRESANDPEHIYTASKLITYKEERVEVLPMKAFEKGELVGDYRKILKTK